MEYTDFNRSLFFQSRITEAAATRDSARTAIPSVAPQEMVEHVVETGMY
jgi:hypothetical protein